MKRKALCVCIGGRVRSVALADMLRLRGWDAIPMSSEWTSPQTAWMLCDWADLIIPIRPRDQTDEPPQFHEKWRECPMWDAQYDRKRTILNLGPDVWGTAENPELRRLLEMVIRKIS